MGAFHTESIPLEEGSTVEDSESGIFFTERSVISLDFYRVKNDKVSYSSKAKTIRFGSPSSFDIIFTDHIQVSSELKENFDWIYFFVYHPWNLL